MTSDLIELSKNRHALLCKWVSRLKEMSDFANPKFKARLVVKGFRQEHDINFDKVFSPVLFILGIVAAEDLEVMQPYVKTTI